MRAIIRRVGPLSWLLATYGVSVVSLLELTLIYLSIFAFSVGVLFMHLRLRSYASLTLIISFSSIVAWINLKDWLFRQYEVLCIEPASETVSPALTNEQQANNTAEAFASMPDSYSFDTISSIVMLALMLIFCVAFFLSARSIRRG